MAVATNALASYEDILLYKDNFKEMSENSTLVEELINMKTQEIHTYCGVEQFLSKSYTEYYDGKGINFLVPHNKPITAVDVIYDDYDWSWASDSTKDSDTYRIVDKMYIALKSGIFVDAAQNVKITYTAGYATIPEDLRLVCIKEVTRDFDRRYEADIASVTLDDGTVAFVEKGLLKSREEVLDRYMITGIS